MSDSQPKSTDYPATVHPLSKIRLFPYIKDRLNEYRRVLFRQTCFGPWLDIQYTDSDDRMIHYVLQKQCCSDDDNFDLPLIYYVNGHSLHFGRREFCLVTGFKFGPISFRKYRNGDIPFRNRLYPEKIGQDVRMIDIYALFDASGKFSRISDEDAIRVCLLLSLGLIFMGMELSSVVDDVFLRMVDDLDAWNSFPWGEYIWRQLYDSIRNAVDKHKVQHLYQIRRNPDHVPSYELSGFLFAFKIWILESSSESERWWTKQRSIIPRALSWRRKTEHNPFDFRTEHHTELFSKAPIELSQTKDEFHCDWYAPSIDFFLCYVPRSPPVTIDGMYGAYLKKRSEAREAKKKMLDEFDPNDGAPQPTLVDRVCDLEGICETLVTLPKEVKVLRGRVHKLECIIKSLLYPSPGDQIQEKNNGVFFPQIKGQLQTEDDKAAKEVNGSGDDSLFLVPGKHVSQQVDQFIEADLDVLNGLCKLSQNKMEEDCEHYKYTYSSEQRDQVIRLVDQRRHDTISVQSDLADEKLQSEIQRLYNHREARLTKIAGEVKQRECVGHMNTSTHMKLAIERCVPQKRKYVDVPRSPLCGVISSPNIPSIEKLVNKKNLLSPTMIERCKSVLPWVEDLSRPFKRIDKIFLNHEVERFLSNAVVGRCKFPWCNDITVDRSFWNGLCGFDDNRQGWFLDEHIDLWIMYLWLTRETHMDWAMVSSYFLPLLIQGSMPFFYANTAIYPVAWMDVERVFIPINEPRRHWSLAMFHICSGVVTFYDSEGVEDQEYRAWYLGVRGCLEDKLPIVLKGTGVFEKKNIDPEKYKISFKVADGVPSQGGVFGDCGVFTCMFLFRLANGIPLALDDPVQAALAYREKMIQFFFKHKMFAP